MQIKLLAFAQARDQLGFHEQTVECAPGETPRQIVLRHGQQPAGLSTWRVAADGDYIGWDDPLTVPCELAIIPPVSGG